MSLEYQEFGYSTKYKVINKLKNILTFTIKTVERRQEFQIQERSMTLKLPMNGYEIIVVRVYTPINDAKTEVEEFFN